ncbi:MAG: Trm112 family protein [Candidatus Kapaibacterium sp.]
MNDTTQIHPRLYDMICCPKCHGRLVELSSSLRCTNCDATYAIEQGIPILLDPEPRTAIETTSHTH